MLRILALIGAFVSLALAQAPGTLENIRVGQGEGGIRAVLDLSGPAEYQVFALENPPRLVVDVLQASQGAVADRVVNRGFLQGYRIGRQPGATRVVFDLDAPARFTAFTLTGPDRIVLDLTFARALAAQLPPIPERLAPGLTFQRAFHQTQAGETVVNLLRADLNLIRPQVRFAHPPQPPTQLAGGALAAINANYFDPATGMALGLVITAGQVLSLPLGRAALGFTADRRPLFGLPQLQAPAPLAVAQGQWSDPHWAQVVEAIEAGPQLLSGASVVLGRTGEVFQGDVIDTRIDRSVVGLDSHQRLVLFTAAATTLPEAAAIAQDLGLVEALQTDSGGSSTLIVGGVRSDSLAPERPVPVVLTLWPR
ncbi:MAG: phosphodiester glycosidase family protein [Deinococcus sp.]|nr:phosphodiester glycosidase family protein [Deinococcus sp.]